MIRKKKIIIKSNRIYLGDCLKLMPLIPDGSIDMILADVPYGTTACAWDTIIPLEPMWEQIKRIIKPNGAIVMTASQPFMSKLVMSNLKMFKYEWIWVKPQGVDPFMSKIRPLNNIEDILVFGQGKILYQPQKTFGHPYHIIRDKIPRIKETNNTIMHQTETINMGDRLPERLLYFKQERGLHSTQKPVALFEYLIKTYTNEGDTVLDFVIGSGTTFVACIRTNRNCIGIEKNYKIFKKAQKRIKQEQFQAKFRIFK